MIGRAMYIWNLGPVLRTEGGINGILQKAHRAHIGQLWIKVADGANPFANVTGVLTAPLTALLNQARATNVKILGWQVPHCPNVSAAKDEADLLIKLVHDLGLDGAIMDAEGGGAYFQGGVGEAQTYSATLKSALRTENKPLGLSSNDIPQNFPGFLPKFTAIAAQADFNFPQVYYGASVSVENRLTRAEVANAHVTAAFVPVGAGFLGTDEGGCSSASACAERAREFLRLVKLRGYQGHAFWHWAGVPLSLWDVLMEIAP